MTAPVGNLERGYKAFEKQGGRETTAILAGAIALARRADSRLIPLITAIAVAVLFVFILNVARYLKHPSLHKWEQIIYSRVGKSPTLLMIVLLVASLISPYSPALASSLAGLVGVGGGALYDRRSLGVQEPLTE